jgi:hypothetical protein
MEIEEILIWLVVANIIITIFLKLVTPEPLTKTHYDITSLSLEDLERIIKEPHEDTRRRILTERLKLQDYHDRKIKKDDKG